MEHAPPSLLYAVKQVELAVRAHLDDLLRPSGTTALQYTALTVLARRAGLTSAELARNAFVTPQSMGDLVTALERRELITRHRDPRHARRLLLSLTPAGEALLERVEPQVRALEERMLADLAASERTALRDYLNRCRTALANGPAQ
ncbi:MarR family winged helix-turn-helix transcriptional regulator [Pseudonocardia sichuanensis]|uniref:DNA-binding MarR family transcriptional regulator n=1 Tax=Pseudonocardia kunmingensis TaxID=630975 RepID=A0A543DWN4_9PSEU|nr:MarR family transcriptional regulator [Pseudonocardia kunmingensis]TQM13734.1 DNA-binding MarR family transcriptional regulator [Pseudonocardia kunmingensis]